MVSDVATTKPHTTEPRGSIQSVERALNILETLAGSGGMTLTELAADVGLVPSTAHHLLATLVKRGYAAQHPTRRTYALGAAAKTLARPAADDLDLLQAADPAMRELAATSGESVVLTVLRGSELATVSSIESSRTTTATYGWTSLASAAHATAPGKAILAWLPEQRLVDVVGSTKLTMFTDTTITGLDPLVQHLRLVRRHRVAVDRDEFANGLSSVAGTIRDANGAVIGAISCCLPSLRADKKRLDELGLHVISSAERISEAFSSH